MSSQPETAILNLKSAIFNVDAPVAQLDRASDYESADWRFESSRAYLHKVQSVKDMKPKCKSSMLNT